MKVQLESTTKVVEFTTKDGGTCQARIWEGVTESGIPVHAYVTRIAVGEDEDTGQFERELTECAKPSAAIEAIPLRMIL
ncbi:MAG: hypothetical protein WA708_01825 [Acidobacteriaceae bacterium]